MVEVAGRVRRSWGVVGRFFAAAARPAGPSSGCVMDRGMMGGITTEEEGEGGEEEEEVGVLEAK